MRAAVAVLTFFALAACAQEIRNTETLTGCAASAAAIMTPGDPPAPVSGPGPVLAGVDLAEPVRALGTEPFWGIDLTGSQMVYSGIDGLEQRARQPRPVIKGTTASFEAETATGTIIHVTLIATECSDGMSDLTYPLTAIVRIIGPIVEKAQSAA